MLNVIAKIKVKAGEEDSVIGAFNKALPDVEKEEGTLGYSLARDQNDPSSFIVLEKYKDLDAFMAHGGALYVAEMIEAWVPHLEGDLSIEMFDEVAGV